MLTLNYWKERPGFLAGILLVLLGSGCEGPSEDLVPISGTLEVWRAEVDLAVGGDDSDGPGMIQPVPLGAGPDGDIYVLDPRLLEVQQYDSTGRYGGLLVRPGEGPQEMRSRPVSFGLEERGIWFTEGASGRIHVISFNGKDHRVEDTGFTFESLGARSVTIEKTGNGETSQYLDTLLEFDMTSRRSPPRVGRE